MSGYTEFPLASFGGGLQLASQPDLLDPSQALDVLDVVFTERGSLRTRDGWADLLTTNLVNTGDSICPYLTDSGVKRLVVGNGNRLDLFNTFPGASVANVATGASPHSMVRWGSPTAQVVYIANGTDSIRKLDATTFSTPTGLTGNTARFVAAWQNRLVTAKGSRVQFSAATNPEDFTAGTYEDLYPGDGEAIQGLVTFRDQLLVFKETKFFVFYAVGSDGTGAADPSWRAVETNVGMCAPRGVAVSSDGVYFLDRKGVYRTSGQDPQQVSQPVEPFFVGGGSAYLQTDPLNQSAIAMAAMCVHRNQVYLSVPTGVSATNTVTLLYDPRFQWWTITSLPCAAMCVFRPSAKEELLFCHSAQKRVGRFSDSYVRDGMTFDASGGTDIAWRWRGGWLTMGSTSVKTVREAHIVGEGGAAARLTRDWSDSGQFEQVWFSSAPNDVWTDDPNDVWTDDPNDVWGGYRASAAKLVRPGVNRRGRVFSLQVQGAGQAAIHSAVFGVRDQRVSTVVQTEVANA